MSADGRMMAMLPHAACFSLIGYLGWLDFCLILQREENDMGTKAKKVLIRKFADYENSTRTIRGVE